MKDLLNKQVFLLDIEGVICESIDKEISLPFVQKFISALKSNNIRIAIVTNISRNPKAIVLEKLRSMDILIKSDELYTSGSTTTQIINDLDI